MKINTFRREDAVVYRMLLKRTPRRNRASPPGITAPHNVRLCLLLLQSPRYDPIHSANEIKVRMKWSNNLPYLLKITSKVSKYALNLNKDFKSTNNSWYILKVYKTPSIASNSHADQFSESSLKLVLIIA